MKKSFQLAAVLLCLLPASAHAHRLDEYLQATILSLDHGTVNGIIRLVPGVAVSSTVIQSIDTNSDGLLSPSERQAYARHVLDDLSLKLDGRAIPLHLKAATFPSTALMRQGSGEIQIAFTADLPPGSGDRTLVFENHHQPVISVYLVNCLEPQDDALRITAQNRNANQSTYSLSFTQAPGRRPQASFDALAPAFRLGARHIAEGTDHLLFLLTLLLPAPLLALRKRWAGPVPIRASLLRILRIVTAFTLGHSLTLALAVFGVIRLPEHPIEILIAVSILVSAIHALRPIFPGREAIIAAFFGLVHGLAFATALSNLGFGQWFRIVSLLGFNLGIETMQIAIVAAVLPSLLLLSRTQIYRWFRIAGAAVAALLSVCWIVERLLDIPSAIDPFLAHIATHAPAETVAFFLFSLVCWSAERRRLAQAKALTLPCLDVA